MLTKQEQASNIYEAIIFLLDDIDPQHQKSSLIEAKHLINSIKLIIKAKLETVRHPMKFRTIVKIIIAFSQLYKFKRMAIPKVDLKLGTAIVQVYDGSQEGLSSFIDSVSLFSDTVDTDFRAASEPQQLAAKETVIRFLKTRLTGKARAAVGDNPRNTD